MFLGSREFSFTLQGQQVSASCFINIEVIYRKIAFLSLLGQSIFHKVQTTCISGSIFLTYCQIFPCYTEIINKVHYIF